VPQGGRGLGRDDLLALAEMSATFRVSDLGVVAADVGQHGSGDLAGLVAGIVRGNVWLPTAIPEPVRMSRTGTSAGNAGRTNSSMLESDRDRAISATSEAHRRVSR
jgi:hypothetical protein